MTTKREREQTSVFRGPLFYETLVGWDCPTIGGIDLLGIYKYLLLRMVNRQAIWCPQFSEFNKVCIVIAQEISVVETLTLGLYVDGRERSKLTLRELKYAGGGNKETLSFHKYSVLG